MLLLNLNWRYEFKHRKDLYSEQNRGYRRSIMHVMLISSQQDELDDFYQKVH